MSLSLVAVRAQQLLTRTSMDDLLYAAISAEQADY